MSTLARLSFWVSPGRMDTFEATYRKKLVPILKKHDLEESSERGRNTIEGVFSRLFEVRTPAEVAVKKIALEKDPAWREVLRKSGTAFGTSQPNGLLRTHFGVYIASAGPGRTVQAGSGVQQGVWRTFDILDGPSVLAILRDREGYLWFGTWNGGVSRYDGMQFTTFTAEDGLPDNTVSAILQDRAGHLWFGTGGASAEQGGGVCRYDGREFTTFTSEDGLASNTIWCIFEDQEGNLWFGTGWPDPGGVSRYDGREFVTFTSEDGLASDRVWCILEDREGNLWFGTGRPDSRGVSRYDGGEFVTFTTEDGLAGNGVTSIVEDRTGHLWFGTCDGGVSRYDPSASLGGTGEAFTTFTIEDGLPSNAVSAIKEDREGNLWFGTDGGGVCRYDGAGFTTFTVAEGLADDTVAAIGEDRDGNIWLGTGSPYSAGGGVCRYDGAQFTSFGAADGLPGKGMHTIMVHTIIEDREGSLWLGAWDGVCRYEGGRFTPLEGLVANVWSIAEDRKGHLWFATFGKGVYRYDPSASSGGTGRELMTLTTEDGLADDRVLSVTEDREGHLWFGTWAGGVSRYDPSASSGETGAGFTTFTTEEGLAHNQVWAILEDRTGHLWFGTVDGVSRYDPSASSGGTGEAFTTLTTEDGLADNRVRCIFQDREGFVWFGTVGGVTRYDPSAGWGGNGEGFKTFTTEDGLSNNWVTSIFQDRDGVLWFSTYGGGVSRYDGLVFQHLDRQHGLVHNGAQEVFQDRHGDFWIATDGGVTRYRSRVLCPSIHLTDVVADRRYGSIEEIRVPVSQRFIAFEFQGGSFTTPQNEMAYAVRLEGYDPDWKPTYVRRVEYHDLPLGEYTFQVKAVDRDLNYSEPATVRVTVEPDPHLEALTDALSERGPKGEFVGESNALRRVQTQLREVAPTDLRVLVLGETGTGKGLAARALHEWSARTKGPFIQVHCGAIPENLVESELFGHEKGAFTGAISRKLGKVELTKGGTLFLDEIGDMPLEAQVKLLRLLEERTFERVGGTETLSADVRIVAATNRDLRAMVEAGTFRQDLYFRLQVFPVRVPSLRERREDIPLLAAYFMGRMAVHLNKEVPHLTPEALSVLQAYDWPGNVRELEHAVQRAVIVSSGPAIRAEDIALGNGSIERGALQELVSLEEHERRYIEKVLEQTGWVIAGAHGSAAVLGLHEATLRSRMKKLGIVRPSS